MPRRQNNTLADLQRLVTAADTTAAKALSSVFRLRKSARPALTLHTLASRLQISARSNLSEFFSGKRRLPPRYWSAILDALEVGKGLERRVLLALLQRDRETDATKRAELDAAITRLTKFLRARTRERLDDLTPVDAEVICAFGLVRGAATTSDLKAKLKGLSDLELRESLRRLLRLGIAMREPRGRMRLEAACLNIPRASDEATTSYLSACIRAADKALRAGLHREHEDAYFDSIVISVQRDRYRQVLDDIRAFVAERVGELETEDADAIVRVNIQIYPTI